MAHGCVPPVQPVHNRPWECRAFITFLPVEDCHAPAMPFWEEARRSFRCLDDAGSFRGVEYRNFIRSGEFVRRDAAAFSSVFAPIY